MPIIPLRLWPRHAVPVCSWGRRLAQTQPPDRLNPPFSPVRLPFMVFSAQRGRSLKVARPGSPSIRLTSGNSLAVAYALVVHGSAISRLSSGQRTPSLFLLLDAVLPLWLLRRHRRRRLPLRYACRSPSSGPSRRVRGLSARQHTLRSRSAIRTDRTSSRGRTLSLRRLLSRRAQRT